MHTRFVPALALLLATALVQAQTPDVLKGHKDLVYSVAFSPDGKTLASGSFDNTAKLWDFAARKVQHTLEGHKSLVYCVAFSKDGKYLATSSQDNTIRLWNPKDGKFIRELKGHTKTVDTVAFSPDSKTLASCSIDKSVRLWNPDDGKEIKKLGDHKDSVYCVAFSPDGSLLASCGNSDSKTEAEIKIWDVKSQKELKTLKVEKSKDAILEVAFVNNDTLLSGGNDKIVRVWNVKEGKETKQLGKLDQYVYGIAVSKDGSKAAVCGYGGDIKVFDIASGKELFKDQAKGRITYCIAFTPDDTAVVTGLEKSTDKKDKGGVVKITKITAK
jgi:WD40 repeat protein